MHMEHRQDRGARARHRAARAGGHPACARPRRLLPARVLGRHAPARDDRPGAVVRPQAADRRRAHHGAGRDHPGPDPGPDPHAARRDRRGRDPGDPRPGRGGRHRRPGGGHVRRPDRGAGHAGPDLLRPPAPLHLGPAGLDRPRRPRPPRAAAGHRRAAAVAGQPARRAATSRPAARTRSTSATRPPPWSSAPASPPATWTAAGWTRDAKRDAARGGRPDRPRSATGRPWREPSGNGAQPLLQVDHLRQHFPVREGIVFRREVASVKAVDDVSFTLHEGETVGLVGESGCGKTTLARTLMRLLEPSAGQIRFDGRGHHHREPEVRSSRCAGTCRWSSRTRSPR